MEFDDMELEESATTGGMKKFGRILAIGIILIVAGFGDVMYIQLMQSHFPAGLLLAVCYIGAFTSFLAIAYMLIGKSVLFTPGLQMIVAWFIFVAELALIALNIILVFQNDGHAATGFLAVWWQMAPATPVLNMAGVAVLFFLDEDSKMRHEDMELAWDIKRAKRRHFKAMARARLQLQHKQLGFLVSALERAVSSPQSLGTIEQTALDLNAQALSALSGRSYAPQIAPPTGTTVDSYPPNTPTPPVTPTPTPGGPAPEPQKRGFLGGFFGKKEPAPAPTYETPKQLDHEKLQEDFKRLQEELAEAKRAQASVPTEQPARYPVLPPTPRYVETEPLARASVPDPDLYKDLVDSVGGDTGPFTSAPSPNGANLNGQQ